MFKCNYRGRFIFPSFHLAFILPSSCLSNQYSSDINQLKMEVTTFLRKQRDQESTGEGGDGDEASSSTSSGATPGMLVDRYNQSKKVVVSVPASGSKRSGFELRLPSMVSFTGKTANQTVFLRILKVIIQLRDLAKVAPAAKAKLAKPSECSFLVFHDRCFYSVTTEIRLKFSGRITVK